MNDEKKSGVHCKPYRIEAARAAVELGYGMEVVKKIKAAKTDDEISRIMRDARRSKFNG